MKKFILIIFFFSLTITEISASEKDAIKKNLEETDNFSFDFEQI